MTCAIRTYLALGAALTLLGCTAAQAPGPAPAPTPQPARAVPVKELAPCSPHQTQAAYIQACKPQAEDKVDAATRKATVQALHAPLARLGLQRHTLVWKAWYADAAQSEPAVHTHTQFEPGPRERVYKTGPDGLELLHIRLDADTIWKKTQDGVWRQKPLPRPAPSAAYLAQHAILAVQRSTSRTGAPILTVHSKSELGQLQLEQLLSIDTQRGLLLHIDQTIPGFSRQTFEFDWDTAFESITPSLKELENH
ncbi:hypothetical protein ABFV80_001421 [Vandammella animalimorsus]|uniref:hypothetical protein n=1 Tax=Vandammella animalimorsus TaxID=2029117 RepID=UPI00325BD257